MNQNQPLNVHPSQPVPVPFFSIPAMRVLWAKKLGMENNLLFATWGGIGDVICSEPTVRYAKNNFKDCKVAVATHHPELFSHLGLDDSFDLSKEKPIEDDWLIFHTIPRQEPGNLVQQFLSHMLTHCVDFPSLSALRMQLPIKDRELMLRPKPSINPLVIDVVTNRRKSVVVHAGRHWESKTFPAAWWNAVLQGIKDQGLTPVLIGKHDGESQGYVGTDPTGCVDLRDKTTLNDSIWMLQQMPVLVCNDSSPLHMAASGEAFILFVASVKHPDYLKHFRHGEFGWRMENFELDGVWNHIKPCPNVTEDVNVDKVGGALVESFLPDPKIFGPLCKERISEYFREV